MPTNRPIQWLDAAKEAVAYAKQVRHHHSRVSDRQSPQREADLRIALTRLREAMGPLRSLIATFPYGPQTDVAEANRQEIRKASEALQRERRKLWKMLPRKEPQDA